MFCCKPYILINLCQLFRFESNQIDQTNSSSTIELVKVTETVLRASHVGGQHDFVVFDVRTAISPNVKKAIVGDVIILQRSVASDSLSSEWISEPSGIISVDTLATSPNHGYAVALRSGQARISLLINEDRRVTLDLVRKENNNFKNLDLIFFNQPSIIHKHTPFPESDLT